MFGRLVWLAAAFVAMAVPVLAADWSVARLRGGAEQFDGTNWVPLARGDVVANEALVRTLADGYLDLQRDAEVVTLSPATQISIADRQAEPYTIVRHDFGTVEVEAEVRPFNHFEVRTSLLAAVVKGTHFKVEEAGDGSRVTVQRGKVAVEEIASGNNTLLVADQTAAISSTGGIKVSGLGQLPPVLTRQGAPVAAAPAVAAPADTRTDVALAQPATLEPRAAAPAPTMPAATPSPASPPLRGSLPIEGGIGADEEQWTIAGLSSPEYVMAGEPASGNGLFAGLLGALIGASLGGLGLALRALSKRM